jgi:hypothetical protein
MCLAGAEEGLRKPARVLTSILQQQAESCNTQHNMLAGVTLATAAAARRVAYNEKDSFVRRVLLCAGCGPQAGSQSIL